MPVDEFYLKLTVAAAVFIVTLEVFWIAINGVPPFRLPHPDATNYVIGRDFLNTWMGGRSFFLGGPGPWFDLHTYNVALDRLLGARYPLHYWSYPPDIVLFLWPFGLMPYLAAYVAWCVIGVALFLFASSAAIARERLPFLAVAPAIAVCVFFGQNGFYTGALLIGGLLCLDRRPLLAGVLFGILTIKPQLGLLLPVMLLFERRWLTIASAIATTAALVVLTAMLFGWNVWVEFFQKTVPQQEWLTQHGGGLLLVVVGTVFYGARLVHVPANIAWILQAIVSVLAFGAVVWTYWRRRDRELSLALLVTATFLFTPYMLNYDMVALAFVAGLLRERGDNTMADHGLIIGIWSLPVAMMIVGIADIPLAPLLLIALACRLLWRLSHADERAHEALPAPTAATT